MNFFVSLFFLSLTTFRVLGRIGTRAALSVPATTSVALVSGRGVVLVLLLSISEPCDEPKRKWSNLLHDEDDDGFVFIIVWASVYITTNLAIYAYLFYFFRNS